MVEAKGSRCQRCLNLLVLGSYVQMDLYRKPEKLGVCILAELRHMTCPRRVAPTIPIGFSESAIVALWN